MVIGPRASSAVKLTAFVMTVEAFNSTATKSITQDGRKTPDSAAEQRRFDRGPEIMPSSELVSWLDRWLERQKATTERRGRLRIPVLVSVSEIGAVAKAQIGPNNRSDAIKLRLNDSALGISLADRVRQMCGSRTECALWIEGFWRGASNGVGLFDVLRVHRAIPKEELEKTTYIEVEAS